MSMEVFYDPACGSSKALAEGGIAGKAGSGKTALLLQYLYHLNVEHYAPKSVFLGSRYGDLQEYKSALYEVIQNYGVAFDFGMYWEDLRGWRRYTRRCLSFETPKTSSYGQLFLTYPKNGYPTCSVELLVQDRNEDFSNSEPSSALYTAEAHAESSFPGQILSTYLFLRQAYRLAAFLLARLAAFFQTPVTSVKKAVSERRFFVLNETHPPDAAALSGCLLAAF